MKQKEKRRTDHKIKKGRRTEGRYAVKQRKKEWVAGAGLIACLAGFAVRIPLGRTIGDAGLGFFAAAAELFAVVTVVLGYGMSRAVSVLVRYRVRREMYKSARRVFRTAMFTAVFIGALTAAGILFFAETVGETVVLEHMSWLALAAAAPAILFAAVTGVLRGYFQGMGTMVPTAHSKLTVKFAASLAGLAFASILYRYGGKVADLLKNEEYASAYGAMGAAFGLSLAGLLGVLHLLLIYLAYAGSFKQQLMRDSSKNGESAGRVVSMLLSTGLPYAVYALLYNMNCLVDQRIFNYAVNVKSQGSGRTMYWGVYYGKYLGTAGTLSILCALAAAGAIPRIAQAFERQEYRESQVRMERTVHYTAITAIPCAVFLAVLAEPVAGILFTGEIKAAVRLLQAGSAVIVLFSFTYLFMGTLQRIRKMKTVILGGLLAFAVHLAVLYVLVMHTGTGIMAVVCAGLVFYLITGIAGFLGVYKYMKYSQEWIRTFVVTLVAAGVSGVIGLLLQKVLLSPAGSMATLLICVFVCVIVYTVLLLVLRGVNREELEGMTGGRSIAAIAEKLHLL